MWLHSIGSSGAASTSTSTYPKRAKNHPNFESPYTRTLSFMAPALSSNSFSLSTPIHHSKLRTPRPTTTTTTVFARTNLFGIGKPPSAGESQDEVESAGAKPNQFFSFDLSKLPDTKSLIPVVSSQSTAFFAGSRKKDPNTVFVSGAAGQSGTRIAQMLLRQGFAVRAGVPELGSALELARLAATYKLISAAESKRLNAVESTFDDPESIAKAIGPATKVVVTIGPTENGPTAAITTDNALQVVRAAELAGVSHIAVVYDTSTSSLGPSLSTHNVLDGITSFFSNFSNLLGGTQPLSISEFLEKVVEMEVSYTLIKASLTDDYSSESSHGLVVSKEGTVSESQVAKSQIAKLVADVFSSTSFAENKVVEVSTSPSATSKPIAELFSAIAEDGRRKAYKEAAAKAKVEEEAIIANEKAREATEAAKNLEKVVKKLTKQEAMAANLAKEAQGQAESAGTTLDSLLTKAKDLSSGDFSWQNLSSKFATAVSQKTIAGKPKTQVATVRGQAKARSLLPQKAVVKPKRAEPKPKPKLVESKTEVRNVFGGLFKQETIYVDED